jgi:hypothetical protein
VALPLLPQLLIQAVAAAELDTRVRIGVTAAQVVLVLSFFVIPMLLQSQTPAVGLHLLLQQLALIK